MATITKNRRRQARHRVSTDVVAHLEFGYPTADGKQYRLPLLNLSASGLSFVLDEDRELIGLEEGAGIAQAAVSLEGCRIEGELLVMHVTADPDSRYVCGALFYPATDTDLVKLKSVIAGMEVAGTD